MELGPQVFLKPRRAQAFQVDLHRPPPEQVARQKESYREVDRSPHAVRSPQARRPEWTDAARQVRQAAPFGP